MTTTDGAPRTAAVVFVGAAGTGVALSARIATHGAILAARWSILAGLGLWALAWLTAVAAVFRLPRRAAVPVVVLAALALRLAALGGPPVTSDDLFRYSWDGRVQAAGVDPYQWTPESRHLVGLREPWLWPDVSPCPVAYQAYEGCTLINRSWARTIYPPVAEAYFAGVYRLSGIDDRYKAWQVAGLALDMGVVALLVAGLRRRGRDPRWAALYALCPAPVLELVNNGHVDGLAIVLALAALVVAVPGDGPRLVRSAAHIAAERTSLWTQPRREMAVGVLIGLAALVKLYPALLVVALVAAAPGRHRPALVRIGGAAVAVAVAGYLPHVLSVGTRVVGYLPTYLREEHYDGAGRYLVAGALRLPGSVAGAASALAVVAAAAWVWWRRPPAPVGAAVLMGMLLAAASPVQPWYAVALLAFAALAVEPVWALLVAAGYPYFFAVILFHPQRVGIGQAAYAGAAVAILLLRRLLLLRKLARPVITMEGCPPSGC